MRLSSVNDMEKEKKNLVSAAMAVIAHAGEAKKEFFSAINHARNSYQENYTISMEKGRRELADAYRSNREIISALETDDNSVSLIVIHAEDQLSSSDTIGMIAEKMFG